jgi:hypothetical protein
MANSYLAAYLNDHFAGSVMAVDLAQLENSHAGTQMARVFSELRGDIESDRRELKTLMDRLHIIESRPRKSNSLAYCEASRDQAEYRR